MTDDSTLNQPNDKPYAIYRTEKHSKLSTVSAASNHMTRELETPNADSDRSHLNAVLIGTDDPFSDVLALVPLPDAKGSDGKKLRRSNSVISIEVLLTTSPEFWETATKQQKADWIESSIAWLSAEYGRENIAHLRIHVDERTPHLTGFVVPLDPDTGRLNARRWLGGPKRLSKQQTEYAQSVEHLGLQRGVKGSQAKHERVSRHYAQIEKPAVTNFTIDNPSRLRALFDPKGWAKDEQKRLEGITSPAFAKAQTAESDRSKRKAALAQAAADRGRADRLQKALDDQKRLASDMRALPLPDVLDALGFTQDSKETERWRATGFNITIGKGSKSSKWFDHSAGEGRGGAIDLVQHAMDCDFKEALAWLAGRFGPGATAADLTAQLRSRAVREVKAAIEEKQPFTPPKPVPENWSHVRSCLVTDRSLPVGYVDRLHELGDLYADKYKNAVFISRDIETGEIVGAERKGTFVRKDGTRFSGLSEGSSKDAGGFKVGNVVKAKVVYIVESAIDAISLFKLRHDLGERDHAVISTAGATPHPKSWFRKLSNSVRRVCAFDNDEAGDHNANKLRAHKFERLRPVLKDWNDDLRALRDTSQTDRTEPPEKTVESNDPTSSFGP